MSQGWIETRVRACEEGLEYLKRMLQDLTQQLKAVQQQARTASSGDGGGGGGAGSFYCLPSSAVGGAAGTWPTLTPASFTADVYQANGAALNLVQASAQCYNFMPAGLVTSKVVYLSADGQGNFDAVTQSCT